MTSLFSTCYQCVDNGGVLNWLLPEQENTSKLGRHGRHNIVVCPAGMIFRSVCTSVHPCFSDRIIDAWVACRRCDLERFWHSKCIPRLRTQSNRVLAMLCFSKSIAGCQIVSRSTQCAKREWAIHLFARVVDPDPRAHSLSPRGQSIVSPAIGDRDTR